MPLLLVAYALLRLVQELALTALAVLNRRHSTAPERLAAAARELEVPEEEMGKAVAYSGDRYRFGLLTSWLSLAASLVFVVPGGLGLVERWARSIAAAFGPGPGDASSSGEIVSGLVFFAMLGLASAVLDLPLELYSTFRIEQKHGFNRQTLRGFFWDHLKGAGIAVVLGTPLLAAILWVMQRMGPLWWLWAWALVVAFNLLAVWIYPTLLAPLFNRFTPLPEGELREGILSLARRVGFRAGGIFVMDASRRTAHGNAYFTGLFGQKRIVLFDTLVQAMGPRQVIAVLAHELGHFKLHHVRWALVRSVATNGLVFFLLSRLLPLEAPYAAFSLERTSYGALVVFGLWFGLAAFLLQPLENALSRRHEFAADRFALAAGAAPAELGAALRALRQTSKLLPIAHPWYSRVHYSHPPLLERLRAMQTSPPAVAG